MPTNSETGISDRPASTGDSVNRGEQWVKHHASEFARLPDRTHVAINCRTGEYVTGLTALDAIDEYERRFGKQEPGYLIEIGGGAFVGWGGGIV